VLLWISLANILMAGSLNQFVLIKARKVAWAITRPQMTMMRDNHGKVVGRPQAPEAQPWFWTITSREQPPSVYNRGYAASREQAMRYFKARYMGATRGSR
jgi:hypothetical protein